MMDRAEVTMLELISQILTKHPNLAKNVIEIATRSLSLGDKSLEGTFTNIFTTKGWGSGESVSGDGSSLTYTENLRRHLPTLFDDFSIRRVLDAPCGDFNWMKEFLRNVEVEYLGADIVEKIISDNKNRYSSTNINFQHLDVTKDDLPDSDLLICRDCLFHFSYKNIQLFVENFKRKNIRYLLTTSHTKKMTGNNSDILDGSYRRIDLFSAPFHFPQSPLRMIDDWIPGFPERHMILWSKEQISSVEIRL